MSTVTEELLAMKQEIENLQTEMAEARGERQSLIKDLKTRFSCKTVQIAERKVIELNESAREMYQQIKHDVKSIQKRLKRRGKITSVEAK